MINEDNKLKCFMAIVGFMLILAMALASSTKAANYTYYMVLDDKSGFDSVMVLVYADGDTTLADSSLTTSFPTTISIVLDKDSAYSYYYYASWAGDDGLTSALPEHIGIWTPDVSASGDGTDTLNVIAYDSLASTVVEGVVIDIKNAGGSSIFNKRTNGSGSVTATLIDGNSYYIYAYGGGVSWDIDTIAFSAGATDTTFGYTLFTPPAAGAANWVNVYMDVGTGFIDSATGERIPATDIEFTLTPMGAEGLNDGSWGYVPKDSTLRPSDSGRVLWSVPANSVMYPAGSYYELRYKRRGRRSLSSGIYKTFFVDTIPDPLNIIDAEAR